MTKFTLDDYRYFLKDSIRKKVDFTETDQNRGVPAPPLEKAFPGDVARIDLPPPEELIPHFCTPLGAAVAARQSHRKYTDKPLALNELAFLLWATQGVRKVVHNMCTLRTVPSAGARHAFETYIYVRSVEHLAEGIYRYLPLEHELLFVFSADNFPEKLSAACLDQSFVGHAACVFFWAAVPYRMEWRYDLASAKVIAIDAGHVCQNLYLAAEAMDAGVCAIAAYDQEGIDALLRLDGKDEFVVYLAAAGKKPENK
jgi:SagB-type dehydrogenase family enzyme